MTDAPAARRDRLGLWCGGVLMLAAATTPLFAWLGPLGFAPLVALMGLCCVPALRIPDEDRPLAVVLLVGLTWAAITTKWSPYQPDRPEESTALKLALQLPIYWAAWWGAKRADPRLKRLFLLVLAWGLAAYGVVLLVEAFTGGAVYQALRDAIHDPIRPDLGRKNVAQGSFVLALLWPVAAAGGLRAGAPAWLALPMAAGAGVCAWMFKADAPVLAVGLAAIAGVAAWTWPKGAPRVMGWIAAAYLILMPLLMLLAIDRGLDASRLPESWSQRVGYWRAAVAGIVQHPLLGWGLDASRAFGPGIQLHPHNSALQLWLELGVLGAAAAAVAAALILRKLSRETPSLPAAAAAGSAAVYLLFGAVSFGSWQEWWLALGALTAVVATMAGGLPERVPVRRGAAKPSTARPPLR